MIDQMQLPAQWRAHKSPGTSIYTNGESHLYLHSMALKKIERGIRRVYFAHISVYD